MVDSVTTNAGALSALSSLRSATGAQASTVNRASTGLDIASSRDGAATFAIATELSSELSGFSAVSDSLNRASSISDIALAAGGTVSDILLDLQELAVAASDPGLDADSATALDQQFQAQLSTLEGVVGQTTFQDAPLLTGQTEITAITASDGSQSITAGTPDFTLGGPSVALDGTASLATPADASAAVTAIDASITNVNAALSELGAAADGFSAALNVTDTVSDSIEVGIGNLVDANLADVAADIVAEEVAVELATISLSIANAAPEGLLTLFETE